ncbi:lysosomal amino acid transporter 1 homolog isoform X3 [Echeneis naucrates]|uniref:lysosomal amino acid transporter 1 homolog isoform X3 n=1 Tax=Echeneis naucrates TaxID=173247 RepID=UPI0011135484|nr:lysosomal amino acid transporter 1 homolog isoform X3 [Echeneis naucrates]
MDFHLTEGATEHSSWFSPQPRQYYRSCKTGNMDSALSIWFLLLWLAGDTCNLVGSFLADQLPLQAFHLEIRGSLLSLLVIITRLLYTIQKMSADGVLTHEAVGWTSQNFTSLCPNGSKWVWETLGECARDARDMASVYLGLLSILCFMGSSLPQYYRSCKTGNMDSALSIWFLLLWLAGDTCNLVGSFLADQLPLQIYTAVYYVLADLLMLGMYLYYKTKNKMNESRRIVNVLGLVCILGFTTNLACFPGGDVQHEVTPNRFSSRTLLSTSDVSSIKAFTQKEIIGFTIGSASSVLYLCSRLPQIYTNFNRKSTKGVSYFLFALVILGNTTYGLSVLLKNPDDGQGERSYIDHHLPWLIGSLGTVFLDLTVSFEQKTNKQTKRWRQLLLLCMLQSNKTISAALLAPGGHLSS